MPLRSTPFINDSYYHVYNRGVNKRKIFLDSLDYQRAVDSFRFYMYNGHHQRYSYYQRMTDHKKSEYFESLSGHAIDLNAYAFMPNHFHFLICQLIDNGISNSLRLFENSYTKYFNTRHKRIGPLLQGRFKAVLVQDDSQLIHLSRYIHLNPLSSGIVKSHEELETYPWTSYPSYIHEGNSENINCKIVLEQFENQSYRDFVSEHALHQQELEKIKHSTFE